MSEKIKAVKVDSELCIGCGVCAQMTESEGYFKLVDGVSEVEITDYENLDTDVIDQTINDCPVGAISKELADEQLV